MQEKGDFWGDFYLETDESTFSGTESTFLGMQTTFLGIEYSFLG